MGTARGVARRHPVATYVVLAYALSWSCRLPLMLTGSVAPRATADRRAVPRRTGGGGRLGPMVRVRVA